MKNLQLVGFNCNRFLSTRHTVGWRIATSRFAQHVDFLGLRINPAQILSTSSFEVCGHPGLFAFTHTPALFKLLKPPSNVLGKSNIFFLLFNFIPIEFHSKCTLHCNHGFSFCKLKNAEILLLIRRHFIAVASRQMRKIRNRKLGYVIFYTSSSLCMQMLQKLRFL